MGYFLAVWAKIWVMLNNWTMSSGAQGYFCLFVQEWPLVVLGRIQLGCSEQPRAFSMEDLLCTISLILAFRNFRSQNLRESIEKEIVGSIREHHDQKKWDTLSQHRGLLEQHHKPWWAAQQRSVVISGDCHKNHRKGWSELIANHCF